MICKINMYVRMMMCKGIYVVRKNSDIIWIDYCLYEK